VSGESTESFVRRSRGEETAGPGRRGQRGEFAGGSPTRRHFCCRRSRSEYLGPVSCALVRGRTHALSLIYLQSLACPHECVQTCGLRLFLPASFWSLSFPFKLPRPPAFVLAMYKAVHEEKLEKISTWAPRGDRSRSRASCPTLLRISVLLEFNFTVC
jgi:hypothetical protein